MADAMTIIKCPSEEIGAFNKRLLANCQSQPVTEVSLHVVHGQPVVTLFSEMVEADEEDVEEAKEAGETLTLGELIPAEPPLLAQICLLRGDTDEFSGKTQKFTERLFIRADGDVVKVLHGEGSIFGFIEGADKKPFYAEQRVNYMLVAYLADSGEERDEGAADQQMVKDLQKT